MKVESSQKGFTLLELLLVTAVGTVVLAGVVGAIFQVYGVTMGKSDKITALEDIKAVAQSIVADMKIAQNSTLVDKAQPVTSMALTWKSWYVGTGNYTGTYQNLLHSINYTVSGGRLRRSYDGGNITYAGRYLSGIQFSRDGDIIKIVITSSTDNTTKTAENQTFQFYLQPKVDLVQ